MVRTVFRSASVYGTAGLVVVVAVLLDASNNESRGSLILYPLVALVAALFIYSLFTQRRKSEESQSGLELELNQLTAERDRLRAEARRARRLGDDLLSNLSHELRSPLNNILAWSQLLMKGQVEAEIALPVIEQSAQAQKQLIDDLLDIHRIRSGRLSFSFEQAQLAAVMLAALDAAAPLAREKDISLRNGLCQDCCVQGDPGRLRQVVFNLVSNAIKFTPKGGSVIVSLEPSGGAACLHVRDTGQGIEPEVASGLFERLDQADSEGQKIRGLGFELAISKYIVERHGGKIRAESAGKGTGASFVVTLPLVGSATVPEGAALPQQDDAPRPWH